MNIEGKVEVNLEKHMPGGESNEPTNDNIDDEDQQESQANNLTDVSNKLKDDLELSGEEDEFDMEYTENDVEDAVVDQFIKWMVSVDGGNRSERSANQHVVAVKLIYSHVKD